MDQSAIAPEGLHAQVHVLRPGFDLSVTIAAEPGQVVAVLGPNGAGKTTLLRALAGLLPMSSGTIRLNGLVLEDVAMGQRMTTEQRPVGVVFQDYLLFPRMSALDNVAFGLRARGWDKGDARSRAKEWLERVGLGHMSTRRPNALSGGQAQRVALARALAADPPLLLLDEPLAALDAGTRVDVRSDLGRHLTGYDGVTLLITHDPLDALVLADQLVVLDNGRVVQQGTPHHVAQHPRTDYVAKLLGLNMFRGDAQGRVVHTSDGVTLEAIAEHDGPVFAVIRPSNVVVHRRRPEGSSRNVWQGTINRLELHGDWVRIHVEGGLPAAADVTPATVAELRLSSGEIVWLSCKATEITVYPQ
jgi:molybdate transport system ATP-binding protein